MAKLILNVDSSLCNFSSHIPDNLIPSIYVFFKLLCFKHFWSNTPDSLLDCHSPHPPRSW